MIRIDFVTDDVLYLKSGPQDLNPKFMERCWLIEVGSA